MKNFSKKIVSSCIFATFLLMISGVSFAASQNIAGQTGLITTPTADVAWSKADLAMDLGFAFTTSGSNTYTPAATFTLFKRAEIGLGYELQNSRSNDDLFVNAKYKIFQKRGSALAIGGIYQAINLLGDSTLHCGQFYFAFTYGGKFFGMPARTTMILGKSFGEVPSKNIDVSMGFDLNLLPKYLKGYVHWINDFANYSYTRGWNDKSSYRGAFNTGIRIAALKSSKKFKLNIDILWLDCFDNLGEFAVKATFGTKMF